MRPFRRESAAKTSGSTEERLLRTGVRGGHAHTMTTVSVRVEKWALIVMVAGFATLLFDNIADEHWWGAVVALIGGVGSAVLLRRSVRNSATPTSRTH
jgi:membrane associated rhomboid family serine protease